MGNVERFDDLHANAKVIHVCIDSQYWDIYTLQTNKEILFSLGDVATSLNVRCDNLARRCPSHTRRYIIGSSHPKVIEGIVGSKHPLLFVNDTMLMHILQRVRHLEAMKLATQLGLQVAILYDFVPELASIDRIRTAFSCIKSFHQFKCGPYRIDLYFPDYKLAVECDEKDHRYKKQAIADNERQMYIEAKLGCSFIRYDPDERGFDIFKVIGQIFSHFETMRSRG
jgi:very-short-patch-repair endonuclease